MNTESKNGDFCSIDGDVKLPIFMLTLLRLGRILLKDEHSVREVMDTKVCKLLVKYQQEIRNVYRPKELREQLDYYQPDFRGGGVKAEWAEITDGAPGSRRRYYLNFERIYKPESKTEGESERQPSPAI
jgi:hypothetical protein